MALHMNLLGDFRLVYENKLVTSLESGRLQELLAYLALHRHAPQSRQYLSFVFWPESSEKQAHTNLRQLLHHLRKALPDANKFIQTDRKMILWRSDASFALDVADFEKAIESANEAKKAGNLEKEEAALHHAVELYHGELLPNCYCDWVVPERERINQEFLLVLVEIIQLLEKRQEYEAAIPYARRLLQLDSYREPSYRCLMRLNALNHDRAKALQTYQVCADTLKQELGVEPDPETQTEYEHLLRNDSDYLQQEENALERQEMLARIAQLPEKVRDLAGLAAAIGEEFSFGLLASASDMEKLVLDDALDELLQHRIIRVLPSGTYAFTQDKMREVAYSRMSSTWKKGLHQRIAEAIEAGHGSQITHDSSRLAYHYNQSGIPEKADAYQQKAASASAKAASGSKAVYAPFKRH